MIGRRIAVHFGLIDIGILLGLLIAVTVLVRRHDCVLLNTFVRPRKCDIVRRQ